MGSVELRLLQKRIAAAGLAITGETGIQVWRLHEAIGLLQQRQRMLRRQIEPPQGCIGRHEREAQTINREVERLERILETLLDDFLDRTRDEWDEDWIPHPIFGFRIWTIHNDGFYGAKMRWPSRYLAARCHPTIRVQAGVPHSEGECGYPPCGIYTTKDMARLLSEIGAARSGLAMGMVALTGKVVEHEFGYRARRAEVMALAVLDGVNLLCTDSADEIDELFGSSRAQVREKCLATPYALENAAEYLKDTARRYQCTLANS